MKNKLRVAKLYWDVRKSKREEERLLQHKFVHKICQIWLGGSFSEALFLSSESIGKEKMTNY